MKYTPPLTEFQVRQLCRQEILRRERELQKQREKKADADAELHNQIMNEIMMDGAGDR